IRKGDKVGFMLLNSNQLYEIIFACGKIGAVFVPINSRFVGPEVKHILEDSDSVALIFDSRFEDEIKSIKDKMKKVQNYISIGQFSEIASWEYEEWISKYPETEPIPDESINELDTIGLMYTGGTTGRPKGAVRSHRSMYMAALLFSIEFSTGRCGGGVVYRPPHAAAAL